MELEVQSQKLISPQCSYSTTHASISHALLPVSCEEATAGNRTPIIYTVTPRKHTTVILRKSHTHTYSHTHSLTLIADSRKSTDKALHDDKVIEEGLSPGADPSLAFCTITLYNKSSLSPSFSILHPLFLSRHASPPIVPLSFFGFTHPPSF